MKLTGVPNASWASKLRGESTMLQRKLSSMQSSFICSHCNFEPLSLPLKSQSQLGEGAGIELLQTFLVEPHLFVEQKCYLNGSTVHRLFHIELLIFACLSQLTRQLLPLNTDLDIDYNGNCRSFKAFRSAIEITGLRFATYLIRF